MKYKIQFCYITFIILFNLSIQNVLAFENFITRKGLTLMDGNAEFRFVSVNIPNYFIVEDRAGTYGVPWHRVTAFEQRDAVRAVKRLGGQVFRTYCFSVEGGRNVTGKLAHIYTDENGQIMYNEDLFQDVDRGLAIAAEEGIRLIIPIVDNWEWFGGFAEWATISNAENFWDDPKAKENFKNFLTWLLNRKNTFTDILYKDDPTVLAWELGNEIDKANATWISEMAAHIKSVDSNHLILDGGHKTIPAVSLQDPNIDMVTTHYTDGQIVEFAQKAKQANKVYLYGEFDPSIPVQTQKIVDQIIGCGVAGCLIWSLRFRTEYGGFYYHKDFTTSDSFQYPGFSTTGPESEREIFSILRDAAYRIQKKSVPPEPIPDTPILLSIQSSDSINWKGSAGAFYYNIQRQEGTDGNWVMIAIEISDAIPSTYNRETVARLPLFSDNPGSGIWTYRVIAFNSTGASEPSNSVTITVE
ncbi:cellulase family glycosylhydrolase [bacterium]|nr:cellulase family glycosylhydrolase [bacterium]